MKKPQTVDKKVIARIYGNGRAWVFTPEHFKDLGSRDAVASALKRYKQTGVIRQLARGLYLYPQTDAVFGELSPTADAIAGALAGRDALRLQPTGAYAANLLGLSEQVPMRIVYLTDGRSRKLQVGNRQIELRQTSPRNMATAGTISGLVIQALRFIGKEHVDDETIELLNGRLDDAARKQLAKDIRHAPGWIAEIFRQIIQENPT